MNELLEVIAGETAAAGIAVEHARDIFPPAQDDLAYVVIPHEYFGTTAAVDQPSPQQLARTVALCVEQPGTPWFETGYEHARACGAAMDISPVGITELRRRGLRAERFQLGYSTAWDGWGRAIDGERPIDVLHLGSANRRRELYLSAYGPTLWRHRARLLLPPVAPKTAARADFVVGEHKRRLLASTNIVLNVRRQAPPYFEWVRALEAICSGAVLVSEHGAGMAPLLCGDHVVTGDAANLGFLADALLRDRVRADAVRLDAYDFVRSELPMRPAIERLIAIAQALAPSSSSPATASAEPPRPAPREIDFSDPLLEADRPIFDHDAALRRAAKTNALSLARLSRKLERHEALAAGQNPDAIVERYRSPAYSQALAPRVSVCVPVFNHADHVVQALSSAAASEDVELELVVLDDASTDGSVEAVEAFSIAHPWVALLLLRRSVNAGLPAGRNALLAHARGELLLMLDSDNELYPTALSRLVAALEADTNAVFAYPILEAHRDGRPDGLLSYEPWDAATLRQRNPIDALALLRREVVVALGGYTEDPDLHGWEDYDLWCTVAESGGHGVHVAQILARYRRAAGSMLSVTDLDTTDARARLATRHPRLFETRPG